MNTWLPFVTDLLNLFDNLVSTRDLEIELAAMIDAGQHLEGDGCL